MRRYSSDRSLVKALSTIAAFFRSRSGGVAPLLALAAVPLVGAMGAAVDYSRAAATRTAMQAALDSTALAVAVQQTGSNNLAMQAQQLFTARFARDGVTGLSVTAAAASESGATSYSLAASASVDTEFMGGLGIKAMQIATRSAALRKNDEFGCVMALSPDAASAIALKGNTKVSLKNCSLYSNSRDPAALSVGGSATLSALSIGVVGGVSISESNVAVTEGIKTNIFPVPDPYSNVAVPAHGSCSENNLTVKTALTITPGVYCNGVGVNAGAKLTLEPGLYVFDRGTFSVNGGASVTGNGVTLVFTSSTGAKPADVSINGDATVYLTAPISGPTAGIVVFGDRAMPSTTTFKFNGGANQYLGGAVYVPSGEISFSGGMGTSTSCTQLIGYKVSFTGNSDVSLNCSSQKTKPFGAQVIRLTR